MRNNNGHGELDHFLRLQQLQQQQHVIGDNIHDNNDGETINYQDHEVPHQESRQNPNNIEQLAHAQENALDQLENVVQNQQMLRRALREGGRMRELLHEEARGDGVDEQDSNEEEGRILRWWNDRERDQGGMNIANVRWSALIHIVIGLIFSMLVLRIFGLHSIVRDTRKTLEHEAKDLSNIGTSHVGYITQIRSFDKKSSSFEAVLEATGNPLPNNNPDRWEAIAKKLSEKKYTPIEKAEGTLSPLIDGRDAEAAVTSKSRAISNLALNAGHSAKPPTKTALKSTPSTSNSLNGQVKIAWRNFRRGWNFRYQIILERLEKEPYTSPPNHLSTLSDDNEKDKQGDNTDMMSRSMLHPWTYFLPNAKSHSTRPTMLKTRERFRSIGFGENRNGTNPLLSTCVQYIDAILKFCEGGGKDDDHMASESDFLVDRVIASTPRLLAIINTFLVLTYVLHGAVAAFFLGNVNNERAGNPPFVEANAAGGDRVVDDFLGTRRLGGEAIAADQTRRQRRVGRERLLGYLLFKVLLIAAVVEPDTLDLFVLLLWFSVLSFLRSLSHVAGSTIDHAAHSGQHPRLGALLLLLLVLLCDGLVVVVSVAAFHDAWNMLLLLTCDCLLIGINAISHIVRHVGATLDEKHRARIAELEERNVAIHNMRRELNTQDPTIVERLEKESRSCDREVEMRETGHARLVMAFEKSVFSLDLLASFVTAAHFLHIWTLHGASFGLVDGVLLLHLQSTLSSAGRKIAERRNLNRILHEIDETFNDASDLDIRKASTSGDVCCVCLVTMTTGNVKKLRCGHLFHKNCLREVVERARSLRASKCPLCRAPLVDGINTAHVDIDNAVNINAQPQLDGAAQIPTFPNNQQTNQNVNEQSLFRFSTEGILPAWLPVPAFAFEVVRREAPALAEQNNGNVGGLRRFFRRGGEEDATNGNQADGQQTQDRQTSFWRRLFVLAGAIPMSPDEEAAALEQLVDMFPQYDRGDLSRELRARGSAEAVVESVFLGVFSGTPRGMAN
eukprot:CCRYP_003373-RA/>CCRYP_003373-RA protein AED:0.01 eAED:0.01 QI:93/1/1/1/1/1/2/132/1013